MSPRSPAGGPLARPGLAPLVDELARRFGDGDVPVTISLRGLPPAARCAVADLLGAERVPGPTGRVAVDRLMAALGVATLDDLRAAVAGVGGPLPNRRAERETRRSDREAMWTWLEREAAGLRIGGDPARMAQWVEAQRARGVRDGLAAHRQRLERALAVLGSLPASGAPLAAFASDHAGGPHALDYRSPLSAIVLEAIAAALGVPRPGGAEEARMAWEAVGVVPDPLSSTVLTLGLPGGGRTPLERWLAEAARAGEPAVVTLANLRRWPLQPLARRACAVVVENPSLLAQAVADGWAGPPLVCSSGRPSVAVVTLLRQLGAAGATLFQHADFDPAGLMITGWLAERAGTRPWRMTGRDYLGALATSREERPVTGEIPVTPWDPPLQHALGARRAAVYEEHIRAELLADAAELVSGPRDRRPAS